MSHSATIESLSAAVPARTDHRTPIGADVPGDIAWSALILNVSAEVRETGETIDGSQQVSLVWIKEADGVWRIIHEHLSGPVRK